MSEPILLQNNPKQRFKVVGKWGFFLFLSVNAIAAVAFFVLGLLIGSKIVNFVLAIVIVLLVFLPPIFYLGYIFSKKAVLEYLNGGPNRWHKSIGISLGMGPVVVTAVISAVINYIFTQQIQISLGLIFISGVLGGMKGEKEFLKQHPPQTETS